MPAEDGVYGRELGFIVGGDGIIFYKGMLAQATPTNRPTRIEPRSQCARSPDNIFLGALYFIEDSVSYFYFDWAFLAVVREDGRGK